MSHLDVFSLPYLAFYGNTILYGAKTEHDLLELLRQWQLVKEPAKT